MEGDTMNHISSILREMVEAQLNEAAALTNGEALKIGKAAKKEAEKIRKAGGKLADDDAGRMEMLASAAFARNPSDIRRRMDAGDTENREQMFKVVASVIGKERAQDLAAGRY
jgi:hypothetical protein